jgi:hypothetical protein
VEHSTEACLFSGRAAHEGAPDSKKPKASFPDGSEAFGISDLVRRELVSYAAPDLGRVNGLVRIQLLRSLQKNLSRFGIEWIGNAAVIDRTDCRALRFVEVTDTLGAAIVCNDVNVIADPLPVADVIAFGLSVASGFKDRFIGTFRQACPTRNTFICDQQCHDPRLLLTPKDSLTILTRLRCPDHSAWAHAIQVGIVFCGSFPSQQNGIRAEGPDRL